MRTQVHTQAHTHRHTCWTGSSGSLVKLADGNSCEARGAGGDGRPAGAVAVLPGELCSEIKMPAEPEKGNEFYCL